MIWPDEEHDSARQLQKKLEYARELEQQIELRRARQREEQLELEELERKFQPDDGSPGKWLVDGGYSAPVIPHPDFASYRSPFRFPQQHQREREQDAAADAGQYNGQAALSPLPPSAGEPSGSTSVGRDGSNGASNSHTRFRITDLQEQSDRLRERAQQLEWKRILDEQVRENARLKQREEEQQRRDEAGSVREEMMFLRDQQLAAQRRMGFPLTASLQSPAFASVAPGNSPQGHYEPLETSSSDHQQQQNYEHLRANYIGYGVNEPYHLDHQYRHNPEAESGTTMPPPAPSRFTFPASSPQPQREAGALQQQQPQQNQSYDSFSESRGQIINEYRSLLAEIRREREELRQEKEQLRLERALLQLENEKMASYVDAQRRLNDQQLEMQRQEQYRQSQLQQQQQVMSAYPSPVREYFQAPPSSVHRSQRPPAFDLSQINHMERSIAALGLSNRSTGAKETRVAPERRPSPVSMDDFAVPQNRLTANVVDSPRFKRLSQFRFKSTAYETAADDGELNALDQSLIGESVFVALSPEEVSSAASKGPPRITETTSPRRGEKTPNSARNELRSSRVIKSRGFYNIESEAGAFPTRAAAEAAAERHKTGGGRGADDERRKKKSAAHKSPSRVSRSAEKSRPQHEKAVRAYEASSEVASFSPSPSAADAKQQQRQRQHHHRQKEQQQRQFASSAGAAVGNNESAVARSDSEESEEPELSRSLFQVKVLV